MFTYRVWVRCEFDLEIIAVNALVMVQSIAGVGKAAEQILRTVNPIRK